MQLDRHLAKGKNQALAIAHTESSLGWGGQEIRTLTEAAGFIRNSLFKRLQIHTVPTLHFKFDRTTERAAELNALIVQANSTRAKDD